MTAAVVVGLAGAGVAVASIPDAGTGLIHACYLKTSGALRVIDVAKKQTCKSTENSISWIQQGSGARSYNGQLPFSDVSTTVVTANDGVNLVVVCYSDGQTDWSINSPSPGAAGFWAWGTETHSGAITPVVVSSEGGQPGYVAGQSGGTTQASVVASFSGHYTHFDISLVVGSVCNYHVMVIPST